MRNHHGVAMAVRRKCGICLGTKIKVFNAVVTSTLLYASGAWTRREEHTNKLETAQYRMAHVRMTTAYETLGNAASSRRSCSADVGMDCKACQYGCHPNTQEHHVLPDGRGQDTMRQAFHALVGHFEADPGFCKVA